MAEFKYEPAHSRAEFRALPGKLPVVFWGAEGVAKDIRRISEFVEEGAVRAAFAVFIYEGRHFRSRPAHPGATWHDWPLAARQPLTRAPMGTVPHQTAVSTLERNTACNSGTLRPRH